MAELANRLSGLMAGIVLLLIVFEGMSVILTGKARVFRWIGAQAKKVAIAVWRWFWRTLFRVIGAILRFLWRQGRDLARWIFSRQNQRQGRHP